MLVIELTDDKFGRAMHNITCIEDKLAEIKSIFEDDATSGNFRKWSYRDSERYPEDRYVEREHPTESRTKEYGKRYM